MKALGDNERPKNVPLSHYFVFRFECDWHRLVNASQGDNAADLAEAQKAVDEAVRTGEFRRSPRQPLHIQSRYMLFFTFRGQYCDAVLCLQRRLARKHSGS